MSHPSAPFGASAVNALGRRFAPPGGFLSGALYLEASDGACSLVWGNGSRIPCPEITVARALRLVARGTWVELPAARFRRRQAFLQTNQS